VLSAQQGDPVAAARLHNMVPDTKKLPPELVTDAIIKVLRNTKRHLPTYIKSGEDWIASDLERPDHLFMEEEEFWRWFRAEVITAANSKPGEYYPKVRRLQNPNQEGPPTLWLPSLSEVPGGRPLEADSFGGTKAGFLAIVGPCIRALLDAGDYPSIGRVAKLTDLDEDTLGRGRKRYKFPSWKGVILSVNNQFGER
jgi:hypothetical protein